MIWSCVVVSLLIKGWSSYKSGMGISIARVKESRLVPLVKEVSARDNCVVQNDAVKEEDLESSVSKEAPGQVGSLANGEICERELQ